jgi:hypothetical protein
MRQRNRCVIVAIVILVVSLASAAPIAHAQDVAADRYSIHALLISGNDKALGGNENFSSFKLVLNGTDPEKELGLNLTVRSTLSSEMDLGNAKLLIISMPSSTTIPNATIIRHFLDAGGSLFLLSNYNGSNPRNCSLYLNSVLAETSIRNVTFQRDAISISNSSPNWQTRTFANNTFAVRVNSSMFQLLPPVQSVLVGSMNTVILSCSLNISYYSDASFVGLATAQSDSGLQDWLLIVNDGRNRSVLCGSASMFNNTYLGVENNQVLLRNLVLWLIQNFQSVPPDLSTYMVLASASIIIAGVAIYVVYMRRRTKY